MPCSSQAKQAFAKPFRRSDSPRDCYVAGVYILTAVRSPSTPKKQLLTDLLVRSLIRQTDVDRQFRSRRNDSITAILTVVEHATHAAVTLLYITALWSGAKA